MRNFQSIIFIWALTYKKIFSAPSSNIEKSVAYEKRREPWYDAGIKTNICKLVSLISLTCELVNFITLVTINYNNASLITVSCLDFIVVHNNFKKTTTSKLCGYTHLRNTPNIRFYVWCNFTGSFIMPVS